MCSFSRFTEIFYQCRLVQQTMLQLTNSNITFQYPVALVNDLTCVGSLVGATSCHAR
jgi:hypothetical protein